MKKITLIILTSCFLSLGFGDNHYPNTATMEALQCKFTQGNDMDDAKRVIAQWNDNADKNFSAPYNAWVLTPLYTSTEDVDFDFAWIGFTENAASMGRVQDEWAATGAETIGAKWERVTDCAGQALYGVIEARAPKTAFVEGQVGYLSVSSCSFKEGKTGLDLAEGDKAWNAYNDEHYTNIRCQHALRIILTTHAKPIHLSRIELTSISQFTSFTHSSSSLTNQSFVYLRLNHPKIRL